MFGFNKKTKVSDSDDKLIQRSVALFMDMEIETARVYGYANLTQTQRVCAEVLMVGAIDFMAQKLKATGEAYMVAATTNLLSQVFQYPAQNAAKRAGQLLFAFEQDDARKVLVSGGDAMRNFVAGELKGSNYALTNLCKANTVINV